MKRIVTHGGGAHRDDFISCCILLGKYPTLEVVRRNPHPEELHDSATWVIDVGELHEPVNHTFDHHQKGAEGCALTQVLQYLGLKDIATLAFPWLQVTEMLDTKGPFQLARQFELEPNELFSLLSPIEEQLLEIFSRQEVVFPNTPLHSMMVCLGEGWLTFLKEYDERLKFLTLNAKHFLVEGLLVVDASCVPRIAKPSFCLEAYCKQSHPTAAVTITLDDRGDGYALFRRNDHPAINFANVSTHPDVIFAHKGGFICKTAKLADLEELILFSIQAVIPT